MTRVFICSAAQIVFVGMYAGVTAVRYDLAIKLLPAFIAITWALVIYNNWRPIWEYVRTWRR